MRSAERTAAAYSLRQSASNSWPPSLLTKLNLFDARAELGA
jgi:hypothetical protein